MPARASLGMQHPMLPGAWGEQPHKSNPPHESIRASFSKRNRLCFIKQSPLGLMPARASHGMQHPMLPGAWGEQPHKSNPPHPKTSAPVSQTFQAVLSAFSAPVLCPQGHRLGLNALRLRGGMGAAQAPIYEAYPLQTREAFMPKRASLGMQHSMLPGAWGEQPHKTKPPHSKTSTPVSKTFQAVFSKENGRVCARPLKEVLCKKAVIPALPRRASWAFPDKRVFALLRWHRPSC